ncbi:MAG: 50S ribosomal protein L15 [Candidatus Peribacteria bacterium]|jgi:large subunit ribosomal protein L15|nr:50S ribosomal protein L15 [Candidatus Peribacteria bacterium]
MKLHELQKSKGFKAPSRRLGRGDASKGNYSGKGHKGQKARAGASVRPFFEGGQTTILMRKPKAKGFKRYYKLVDIYEVVNVSSLDKDPRITAEVTKESLKSAGYIKNISALVKILGNGELSKALTFTGIEKFTKSALEKIEKAGGKIA